ncbi:MAG: hypothetical protein M1537_07200 [Nitrospirae bacterium]|nr:hypothetical protein [Nitrospirota bacterium]
MAKVITEAVRKVKITTETDILIDIQHLVTPIVHLPGKEPQPSSNKKGGLRRKPPFLCIRGELLPPPALFIKPYIYSGFTSSMKKE